MRTAETRPIWSLRWCQERSTTPKHYLAHHPDTRAHFERVAELVEGFETSFGLELLSTVHWLAMREDARTEDAIVARAYAWSDRKKQFSEGQLRLALDVLSKKNWLPAASN